MRVHLVVSVGNALAHLSRNLYGTMVCMGWFEWVSQVCMGWDNGLDNGSVKFDNREVNDICREVNSDCRKRKRTVVRWKRSGCLVVIVAPTSSKGSPSVPSWKLISVPGMTKQNKDKKG